MTLAMHVHPAATVPIALLLAAGLLWYWLRLGRPAVPRPRRLVRRTSIVIMLLAIPALVRGLSFLSLDTPDNGEAYMLTWSVAFLLVLLVLLSGLVDVLVSMRLHRHEYDRQIREAGAELREALQSQSDAADSSRRRGSG